MENTGVGGAAVLTDVVPSKTLIATADAAQAIDAAGDLGVQFYAKRRSRTSRSSPRRPSTSSRSTSGSSLLPVSSRRTCASSSLEAGVNVVSGHGRMKGDNAVVISTGPDGTDFDQIEADTIVISTGPRPRVSFPAAKPDGKRILTWKQVYDLAGRSSSTSSSSARASPAQSSPRRT